MDIEKMARAYKALSSPKRLELFLNVYKWGQIEREENTDSCCGPVHMAFSKAVECMDLSRSTISHHIKELQQAGLIVCEREGQSQNCTVNESLLEEMKDVLG